jgi:L-fuconolactonase
MIIDAHQHLWVISEREYSWITPDLKVLNKDFKPEHFLNVSNKCGIDGTVLVQSADSYEDTFYMMSVASEYDFVKGIVGWIPFDRPNEANAAIKLFKSHNIIKGFRNLTHDYSNPKYGSDDAWIRRDDVLETLKVMAQSNFSLDYVAVNDNHLQNILDVAKFLPDLRIVIDHLGKPNIAMGEVEKWMSLIKEGSRFPNLFLKLSGLNTASQINWKVRDWKPFFDTAYNAFGPDRIIMGGDWPVIELNDSYEKVWSAQLELIQSLEKEVRDKITGENAINFYKLKESI